MVETQKDGVFVYYRLVDETVADLSRTLRVLAHSRLAELEQITRHYFQGRDSLEPINRKTLLARAKKGEVIVLDVRPAEEYQAGHLPHARSIPFADLELRVSELPKKTDIVAYCRGPYCVWAGEAVALLRDKGFQAVRLEDSVHDWRAHGLPVSAGDTP
jgi:rhodanese-related sulfurtransferase